MFDADHLAARAANTHPLTPLDLLARTLERHPDRPGVAWRDDTWTYGEFADIVARMAGWLAGQGITRGDVVSVVATNRPELLAAHYAVPALGAVLNTLNTRLEADDFRYVLEHSGSRMLLVDPAVTGLPGDLAVPAHTLCEMPGATGGLDFFNGPVPELDLRGAVTDEHQPIALNYTSGTTARPKGVVYTHRGAYLNALGNVLSLGMTRETRYLWTLPMFHCNGWCHTWAVTAAGGLHVCLDRVDPELILETIRARDVTLMCCAPVVLYMLLHEASNPVAGRVLVGTGGAAPTPALLFGLEELGFDLVHLYGLTESYGPATLNDPEPREAGSIAARAEGLARQGLRHLTAGRARVLDEEGRDVPSDGQTMGEISIAGNTLMAGYFRDAEATETAFRGGLFRTGDMAVMHPDGQIEIRDRAKDVIISGGENISSLEVETALHRHEDVLLAAVVAAPHEKWGEVPWAFVELKDGAGADATALDAFCRDHLAGFKRPKNYVFGPLPKTATGKIQKFRLREIAREEGAE